MKKRKHPLIGMCFYTFDANDHTKYEGQVLRIGKGVVIAQIYSRLTEDAIYCRAFNIKDVKNWTLYECREDQHYHYEESLRSRDERIELNDDAKKIMEAISKSTWPTLREIETTLAWDDDDALQKAADFAVRKGWIKAPTNSEKPYRLTAEGTKQLAN